MPGHVRPQGIIHFLLIAQGVYRFFHHVLSACRTRTMRRVHDYFIWKRHNFGAKAIEKDSCQFLLSHIRGFLSEIGAAYIA